MKDIRDREIPLVNREVPAERMPLVKALRFPNISWGAIFGGVAVGIATHLLLMLLGVAAGLSAVDPQSAEPVGHVPMMVGVWNLISMLASAFVGGFVAARMSGLSRRNDGVMHGFVAWGVTTLLFAYVATTALGAVIGGAFSVIGGGVKAVAQAGGQAAQGQGQDIASRLQSIIKGGDTQSGNAQGGSASNGGNNAAALGSLQQALSSGDRDRAIDIMVNQMGLSQERAQQVAEQGQSLFSGQASEQARQTADQAVSTAAAGSWWLFFGLLLSLAIGMVGGALGASSSGHRRANRGYPIAA
jgi:hypothetical protein